jgi:hypothetical protein
MRITHREQYEPRLNLLDSLTVKHSNQVHSDDIFARHKCPCAAGRRWQVSQETPMTKDRPGETVRTATWTFVVIDSRMGIIYAANSACDSIKMALLIEDSFSWEDR